MNGYRTYTMIILSILGGMGVFEKLGVTQEDVANSIDLAIQLGAGVFALWLNYQNHKKMV